MATHAQADIGLNIYGLSYHLNGDKARELGIDNQVNPGLGVRLRAQRERWDWIADAGVYHDSGRHTATIAGGGALWHATARLRLGAAAVVFHSDTYNHGRAFLTPLPLAAYELGPVTLNAFFTPKLGDVNDINTFGFWATIWLR
jgi:hypothetical protein